MSDNNQLMDLYRRSVLQHSRKPKNFGRLEAASLQAEGHNPLCGDKVTIYLTVAGENIEDIAFEGIGCAISLASASMMTETIKGTTISTAVSAVRDVVEAFTHPEMPWGSDQHGELAALSGVREYPSRIKCATLPWKTLSAAIARNDQTISTE